MSEQKPIPVVIVAMPEPTPGPQEGVNLEVMNYSMNAFKGKSYDVSAQIALEQSAYISKIDTKGSKA